MAVMFVVSSKSELLETFGSVGTATIKRKPTQVQDRPWVYHQKLEACPDILGKWLVFKHFDVIDEVWEQIHTAIDKDELGGCVYAKCSTTWYNPGSGGPGPSMSGVMCVCTEKANMDAIGFKLIEIVKQDIRYKTNAATHSLTYAHSSEKVTSKTIYWNNGQPSFVRDSKATRRRLAAAKKEDKWQINVVMAPEPLRSQDIHGRWILCLEYTELTHLWHRLKDIVESREKNFGIIKMVCPPKHVKSSRTEKPVFHLYTSSKDSKTVGLLLIEFVKRDIEYEECDGMAGAMETLFWNGGNPGYEEAERRGVKRARDEFGEYNIGAYVFYS